MSSNADFVQYVIDQCSGAGEITVKKMFGEYGLYCDGTFFGVVCDNRLFVKHTEAGAVSVPEVPTKGRSRPYTSRMSMTANHCLPS